jgi:hypothetical protein
MKKKSVCSSRRSGGSVLICTSYLHIVRSASVTAACLHHSVGFFLSPTNLVVPLAQIRIAENVRKRLLPPPHLCDAGCG